MKKTVDITISDGELMALAENARESSYCPYSGYSVGAALLCADGSVYLGVNVENSSYGGTICAERASMVSAVSDGQREFLRIAVAGGAVGKVGGDCTPCGICRQFLFELCDGDFDFIIRKDGALVRVSMRELMPYPFNK